MDTLDRVGTVGTASPWARLGLRWNPFGEPPPEDVADLVVLPELGTWEEWLRRPRTTAQFLGHQGRGKTARLRRLQASFPGVPYLYLGEDRPLPDLPLLRRREEEGGPVLLLDEAQRLPRRKRRRLFRRVAELDASLVVGSHEDLAGEMRAAGLEPKTEVVEGLKPDRLRAIVDRRLEWARRSTGEPAPSVSTDLDCSELADRFGDDLRSILDHLYEIFQRRAETTNTEARDDGEM